MLPCDFFLLSFLILNCGKVNGYVMLTCTYFRLPPFCDIHISQGGVVTHLRCSGMFKYELVAKLPMSISERILNSLYDVSCFDLLQKRKRICEMEIDRY